MMNEATVRAEVLDPLISRLGYRYQTDLDVIREHQFLYPRVSLGRKSKKDPDLVGRPDYVCTARGIATWVLEAKAEGKPLGTEEDKQAYTYAAHPEIRAIYYCLSDGRRFIIYDTYAPVSSPPILDIGLSDTEAAFTAIDAFLGEAALSARQKQTVKTLESNTDFKILSGKAHFQNVEYDLHAPPFLRAAIEQQVSSQIELLKGTIYPIESGSFKIEGANMTLEVELGGQSQADIEFQKLIGIDVISFSAVGNGLSTDPDRPTVFQTVQRVALKPGDTIQSSRVAPVQLPYNLNMSITVDAYVYLTGDRIAGSFRYSALSGNLVPGSGVSFELAVSGELEIIHSL